MATGESETSNAIFIDPTSGTVTMNGTEVTVLIKTEGGTLNFSDFLRQLLQNNNDLTESLTKLGSETSVRIAKLEQKKDALTDLNFLLLGENMALKQALGPERGSSQSSSRATSQHRAPPPPPKAASSDKSASVMQKQIASLRLLNENLTAKIKKLEEKVDQLTRENQALETRKSLVTTLTEKLSSTQTELATVLAEREVSWDWLQNRIEELEEQISGLATVLAEREVSWNWLQSRTEELERQIKETGPRSALTWQVLSHSRDPSEAMRALPLQDPTKTT